MSDDISAVLRDAHANLDTVVPQSEASQPATATQRGAAQDGATKLGYASQGTFASEHSVPACIRKTSHGTSGRSSSHRTRPLVARSIAGHFSAGTRLTPLDHCQISCG